MNGTQSITEHKWLRNAVKNLKGDGVIVELGCWEGSVTINLAQSPKEVHAIDCVSYSELFSNIKNCKNVKFHQGKSEDIVKDWKLPIDLIFIDIIYYDYEMLKKTVEEWSKFASNGGKIIVAGATPSFFGILENKPLFGLPAPKKVAIEMLDSYRNCGIFGNLFFAEKSEKINLFDKIKNKFVILKMTLKISIYNMYLILKKLPQPIKYPLKLLIKRL